MRQHLFFILFLLFSLTLGASISEQFFTANMSTEKIAHLSAQIMPTPRMATEITFKADIPIDQYELRHLISFKEQEIVDAQQIQQSVQNLFKKNKFKKITLSAEKISGGVRIIFELESHWTFSRCTVAGMIRGKNKYRFLYGLRHGEVFDEHKHQQALESMKNSLRADGYINCQISADIIHNHKKKMVDVRLHVRPGTHVVISAIELSMKSSMNKKTADELQKKIYGILAQEKGAYFSADIMEKIPQEIQHLLEQEGFFGAHITIEKHINADKKTVTLFVTISFSGKQLVIQGNSSFSSEEIKNRIMPHGAHMPLLPAAIMAEDLEAFYKERNYLDARVRVHQDEEKITLVIEEDKLLPQTQSSGTPILAADQNDRPEIEEANLVCEQPSAQFGTTIVRGQLDIPFRYIERELCYKKGDVWDPEKIDATLTRLKNLNIFEHIHIFEDSFSINKIEKSILIDVEPATRFELLLRGGIGLQRSNTWCWFGANTPYAAGGSFLVRNISGHADSLLINADVAHGCQAYSAAYTVPWLWNSPTNTTLKGYGSNVDQPAFVLDGVRLYETYKGGILLSLQRHFDVGIDCHLNTGCEWLALRTNCQGTDFERCVNQIAAAYDIDPCMLGRRIPYFFVEPSLVFSYDQDLVEHGDVQPLTFLTAKIQVPFGSAPAQAYFVRLLAEQSFFFPMGKILGALRGRLGHIITPCFARVSPLERFYAGGVNSVRSYETDMAPPYGLFYDDTGCCRFVPQGAQSIAMLSAEVRAPLFGPVGAVIFQDVGALKSQQAWKKENNVVLGTGFGLRYLTPIGTLSFDVGWKWWTQPGESCYAWFLSLGNSF